MIGRKLRFGMVGGGRGAFIGAVHRIAAQMDGQAELVAGAFSSDPRRSRDSAADLFVAAERAYGSYRDMAVAEAARPSAERLDFVVIVTPNDQHFPAATLFLDHGFNVVCDKPVTLTLAEARALRGTVARSGKVFALTHNYTGNAMVKQARALVRNGALGTLRKVVVEYSQGWLARDIESGGHKQAAWRTDPARSGAAGCMGDIGVHAENLARYVTGLRIAELCADLATFVPGRRLEDDGNLLLRFEGGARGVLHASQVAVGEENNLSLRVYGSKASLEWQQEHPDELIVKYPDRPREILRRGNGYASEAAQRITRIPAGHPEGYLEAFANLYREAFRAIAAEVAGEPPPDGLDLPGIDDGVAGMAFIEAAVASARQGAAWVPVAS
ncbi:Gfo/Idh/MocA family protein [Luteimonas sp. R10]|uniref:Gfo/Idh/MocA family protein n=1 Tax=Luteimonas sp. R10 TaxID=3108176 RepID=UPI00308DA1CB|nr:Gfo/Idh/MocA family oxidoreductase [Luteimonas sp. R10]